MTNAFAPRGSGNVFDLTNVALPSPVERVVTPSLRAQIPDAVNAVTPQLLTNPSQVTVDPRSPFANLPAARQWDAPLNRSSNPRIDRNYQRNLTTLQNKYDELEPFINSLSAPVRNALIDLDATRVSQGSAPLTREQTLLAASTAQTDTPATPAPDRASGPFGWFSNIGRDLSDILKSLPQIVPGLIREIKDLPNIAERYQENIDRGLNPLAALAESPGLRMIPGAFTVSNLSQGNLGYVNKNPLFAALDVLPIASAATARTATAKAVQLAKVDQIARLNASKAFSQGRMQVVSRPRPIAAVLMNRLDDQGNLTRSRVGQLTDDILQNTPLGQRGQVGFGKVAREVERDKGWFDQRLKMLLMGYGTPTNQLETVATKIAPLFDKWESAYPALSTRKARNPKQAAFYAQERARIYNLLETNPDQLIPGFVNDIRNLINEEAALQWNQGKLGRYDGEWFDTPTATKLANAEERLASSSRLIDMRNEYLTPSGTFTPKTALMHLDGILGTRGTKLRARVAEGLEHTLDAYNIDTTLLRKSRKRAESASVAKRPALWQEWADQVRAHLDSLDPDTPLTPRRDANEIVTLLRSQRQDRLAGELNQAIADGNTSAVNSTLRSIYDRKPPTFPDALYPSLRSDIQSLTRRRKFDADHARTLTRAHERRAAAFTRQRDRAVPARFTTKLSQEIYGAQALDGTVTPGRVAQHFARTLGTSDPDTIARIAADVYDRQWANLPGIDPDFASQYARTVQDEVARTWRTIRASLPDDAQPVYVHKVSPSQAQQVFTGKVGPVPPNETHLRARSLDLTPDNLRDVQVSLTHQIGESLQRQYSEQFIEQVIERLGKSEADISSYYLDTARRLSISNPGLSSRGWLQKLIEDSYVKFNPDEMGMSWGGARLTQFYKDNPVWIPKAIAGNLKNYVKQPNVISTALDPLTKMFRYNVIGLSPQLIINNFLSNAVVMTAERGLRPWKHLGTAVKWLKNPNEIPFDDLRAMMLAEAPHMEHLGMDAMLTSRTPSKLRDQFSFGVNSAKAFESSVWQGAEQAAKYGKSKLDFIVEKSLTLQRLGDNVYRAMMYMDEIERAQRKAKGALTGQALDIANANALDLIRRTYVDYSSFTPLERNAIRSYIPFYSYMGHAARLIWSYPLNHPLRAFIIQRTAQFERERLGSLPGSFLSFFPLGGIDPTGSQTFLSLRPFDPFGDQADLMSVAGWMAAMNPAIQIALQQVGVVRGQTDLYPTKRYNPETGRMEAVTPSLLTSTVMSAAPRVGVIGSLLGMSDSYNELRARDPDAANRSLLAQLGIPRVWQEFNVPQEQMRAELTRYQVSQDVLNDALRSGDWSEALRYPSLSAYYDQLQQLTPDQLAALTPADPDAIAKVLQ